MYIVYLKSDWVCGLNWDLLYIFYSKEDFIFFNTFFLDFRYLYKNISESEIYIFYQKYYKNKFELDFLNKITTYILMINMYIFRM